MLTIAPLLTVLWVAPIQQDSLQPRLPSLEQSVAAMSAFHLVAFGDSLIIDVCALDHAFNSSGALTLSTPSIAKERRTRQACRALSNPILEKGSQILSMTQKGDSVIVEAAHARNFAVGWKERFAIVARRSGASYVAEYKVTWLSVQ